MFWLGSSGDSLGIYKWWRNTYKLQYTLYFICIPSSFVYSSLITSSDEGLWGPKHVVSRLIKTCVCVIVTPPFLFVSTTNNMKHYKAVSAVCHQLSMKEFYFSGVHVFRREIKFRLTLKYILNIYMSLAQVVFSTNIKGGISMTQTCVSFYLLYVWRQSLHFYS
jgi:hypothetical protein